MVFLSGSDPLHDCAHLLHGLLLRLLLRHVRAKGEPNCVNDVLSERLSAIFVSYSPHPTSNCTPDLTQKML